MPRRSSCSDRALLALALLAPSCKCGGDGAPDAGAPAASAASAAPSASASAPAAHASAPAGPGMDAGRASDAGPDYAAGECPDFDPDRWSAYDGLPNETACWFFTPKKDKLPRPLAWVPCARPELGARCRKLALPTGERLSFAGSQLDYRSALAPPGGNGPVRLQAMLECEGQHSLVYLAADADGPVFGAMAIDPDGRCSFAPALGSAGWTAGLRIMDPGADLSEEGAPFSVVGLKSARGQLVPTKLAAAPPREGVDEEKLLEKWHPFNRAKDVGAAMGVPPDGKNIALQLGTDGADVVWSVGPRGGECTMFTARYVEDPRQAAPTRVAALPCKDIDRGWKVGCGFAATTTGEGQALVVRLKDATSYRVAKLSAPLDREPSAPTLPLAITCSEIFLGAGGATATILRIPTGALPDPTPAAEPPRPSGSAAAEPDAGAPTSDASADGGR